MGRLRNKDKLALAKLLGYFSVVCTILAFIGSLGTDLWLASTQWLLVGLTCAVWAVFVLIEGGYKIGR